MMRHPRETEIDSHWARVILGSEPCQIREAGIHLLSGKGFSAEWVMLYSFRESHFVVCHSSRKDIVNESLAKLGCPRTVDCKMLADALGDAVLKIAATQNVYYLSDASFQPGVDVKGTLRQLEPADSAALEKLKSDSAAQDLETSQLNLDHSYVLGYFDSKILVSAADYKLEGQVVADINVLTHPNYRGRGLGLGRMVSSKVSDHALKMKMIPQWWAYKSNYASLKLANTLGYFSYATIDGIRIKYE